jgi:hypothetical protein
VAVDAAAPDGALSTVTAKQSNARSARSADTDTESPSESRDDEMTTSTTEPASNDSQAENRPVDAAERYGDELLRLSPRRAHE